MNRQQVSQTETSLIILKTVWMDLRFDTNLYQVVMLIFIATNRHSTHKVWLRSDGRMGLVRMGFAEAALLQIQYPATHSRCGLPIQSCLADSSDRIPAIVTCDPDPHTYSRIPLIALSSL